MSVSRIAGREEKSARLGSQNLLWSLLRKSRESSSSAADDATPPATPPATPTPPGEDSLTSDSSRRKDSFFFLLEEFQWRLNREDNLGRRCNEEKKWSGETTQPMFVPPQRVVISDGGEKFGLL